jgi:hypothetical protein
MTGSLTVGDNKRSPESSTSTGAASVLQLKLVSLVSMLLISRKLTPYGCLAEPRVPIEPSVHLTHSLLSLSSAIQHLCPHADPSRREDIAGQTLRSFITDLVNGGDDALCRESCGPQLLTDLAFLERLAGHWGATLSDVCDTLTEKANHVYKKACFILLSSYAHPS